jgi:hypothetical protein
VHSCEPKLLVMDEALSNLDAKLRGEMCDEMKDLTKTLRVTILHVTHDQTKHGSGRRPRRDVFVLRVIGGAGCSGSSLSTARKTDSCQISRPDELLRRHIGKPSGARSPFGMVHCQAANFAAGLSRLGDPSRMDQVEESR